MERLDIPNPFGGPVFFVEETGSTMDEAAKLAEAEESGGPRVENGTAVLSAFQSGGRGRLKDRRWSSSPGKSVLATLIIRRDSGSDIEGAASTVSLRTALGISLLLEQEYELRPKIKWPNDVMVRGCKISGILGELRRLFIFVGIGINCLQEATDFRELQKREARCVTSIRMETGMKVAPAALFGLLLPRLASVYRMDPREMAEETNKRLFRRNERVRVALGHPEREEFYEGKQRGVAEDGTLLLEEAGGGLRQIASGEFT